MARVLTFSTQFPSYHPKGGQPTFFVEKLAKSLHQQGVRPRDIEIFNEGIYHLCDPKHHTIRSGNRWKAGDKFSPRIWSGKPYDSKQIIIGPDIEIKKVWNVEREVYGLFSIEGKYLSDSELERLAQNDGLSVDELWNWIEWPCKAQIICWNENIKY